MTHTLSLRVLYSTHLVVLLRLVLLGGCCCSSSSPPPCASGLSSRSLSLPRAHSLTQSLSLSLLVASVLRLRTPAAAAAAASPRAHTTGLYYHLQHTNTHTHTRAHSRAANTILLTRETVAEKLRIIHTGMQRGGVRHSARARHGYICARTRAGYIYIYIISVH